MSKFIHLTTRKVDNLPLGYVDKRPFKISLNVDHIVLVRPNAADSNSSVLYVDSICSSYLPLDFSDMDSDERANVRTEKMSMIIVEESYEQVRKMLVEA